MSLDYDVALLVRLRRCSFVQHGACDGVGCDVAQFGCEDRGADDEARQAAEDVRTAQRARGASDQPSLAETIASTLKRIEAETAASLGLPAEEVRR
jgi:hypothetical protein